MLPYQSNISVCLVLFSSSGDPRYLHSFPTRRSSDLGHNAVAKNLLASGREVRQFYFRSFAVCSRNESRTDRKSTRLNSSHGYISYAVFCLKKKKSGKEDYCN